MDKIKVAVIVPDRNDRPEFLQNCIRMIKAQTRQPDILEIINYKPLTDAVDITQRYRTGYQMVSNQGADVVLFMENDDYYHPEYIEYMVRQWHLYGQPELLGHQYTIYYHLGLRKMCVFHHIHRSSAMNTLIKAGLSFDWGQDHNPYTDSHIWLNVSKLHKWKKVTTVPPQLLCIGIKHGVGKTGGEFHSTGLERFTRTNDIKPDHLIKNSMGEVYGLYNRYRNNDSKLDYLRLNMDAASYAFYSKLCEELAAK